MRRRSSNSCVDLKRIYAKNGLTLTDAVNVFFQQSLNTRGFPFKVTENNAKMVKAKALNRLMKELDEGMSDPIPMILAHGFKRCST